MSKQLKETRVRQILVAFAENPNFKHVQFFDRFLVWKKV